MSPELDHAEQVAWVWRRIVAGDRIRMFCDYYGGHWIELTPCWQFWSKRRRLTPTGMFEIRSCRKIAALGRAAIMSLFE